jgi:hypothetical protein
MVVAAMNLQWMSLRAPVTNLDNRLVLYETL